MISMQRSFSSPVRVHSSSSHGAHDASNYLSSSPTPSPDYRDADTGKMSFPIRSRSPTSTTTQDVRLPTRRSEDMQRRSLPYQSSNSKPVIAQSKPPSTPPMERNTQESPSPSPASDRSKPYNITMLSKFSSFTTSYNMPENETTTLEELAHLVRLSKYQERKRANTRVRLQRNLISTALSARLTRCGEITRRNLVDCFRTDEKRTFAALYSAVHNVRKSCDELRRYALLEPELDSVQPRAALSTETLDESSSNAPGNALLGGVTPFLNEVSASARETFLDFLSQIRTNPDYLATRLCSLTTTELNALTSFHHGLEPIESVLPYHGRSANRGHATNSSRHAVQQTTSIERLLSFQRHDPLSALIHTCFANSAGPDSAEDRRRTDVWATTLARLITESKSNSEHIMICVLNVWAAMRDWAGKSNMEWYLMKILQDGAFLLDRAEDQHGTRFNLSDWTAKDSIRAEEFYDNAVHELFRIVDDEDSTGIPEGLVELGNAVLKQLDTRLVESTRNWFVYKWLFSSFLFNVIIHPETYGMMSEHHITEYGRQKILKQVAMRAHQLVVDVTWNKKGTVSIPSEIQGHVEHILNRFGPNKAPRQVAKLLPARSITSLRETVEVHPYLVISSADLVTLVNALFPERRPMSAQSSGLRSAAPSISGMSGVSQPISMTGSRTGNNFETSSVFSTSASSVLSDATTSRDTHLEEQQTGSSQTYSPPMLEHQQRMANYEDDGYRLRFALRELAVNIGIDAVQGSCHPCQERWAVLFISSNGTSLSGQMTYDPEDEVDAEENSSTSDTDDDDGVEEGPELDKDYHQLRDSILKLVQDFEIPHNASREGSQTQFSNRATGIRRYRSKNKIITTEKSASNRNPYRKQDSAIDVGEKGSSSNATDATEYADKEDLAGDEESSASSSVLINMLTAASSQSRAQSDFVSAHLYWKTLQQLNTITSPSLRRNGFATLLNIFSRGPRDSIRRCASAVEEYDAWLVWLKQSQERHEGLIEAMMNRMRALRDKMWYVTDVRNSAPYEQSRNICAALKTMGMPRRWGTFQRNRAHVARGPTANYLYRTETQIMDLLSASEEQGGPNKLSNDQAEKTTRWLRQSDVANFCGGEERIHRFCCEVDACLSKLVGESILDTPVLWSSDLYQRDRKGFEGSKTSRERDQFPWHGIEDSINGMSDPEKRVAGLGRSTTTSSRDLRTMSAHNSSQQSFDSGSHRFSRASTVLSDIIDGPDYFGMSSPVHTIDSNSTYWSPFQSAFSPSSTTSRAQSPATSVTNLSGSFKPPHQHIPSFSNQTAGRPGTAVSSTETVYQQRQSEEKARFLAELRQTLLSLLLSDLGNLVFASGCETDSWFQAWGQECIDREDAQEQRATGQAGPKSKYTKSFGKPRVIEKKKSFGNLRTANESDKGPDNAETASANDNDSSATSDTISARGKPSQPPSTLDFPFKKAFQRLLRMFSVHPSPHGKLGALYELEQLIVASLANTPKRSRLNWIPHRDKKLPDGEVFGGPRRSNPLVGVIDNLKQRRSHALSQSSMAAPSTGGSFAARSNTMDGRIAASSAGSNTDAITNVLRNLLRDGTIRPATLFRDLQFIAAFTNPGVLDNTDRGKAFWNTGLAALNLKSEVCRSMLQLANEIQRSSIGKQTVGADTLQQDSSEHLPPTYGLADAGKLWTVLAKEGDPAAQRELALFYLMSPELVDRTTLPLSKPNEVFKQAVMDKYDRGSAQTRSNLRLYASDRSRSSLGVGGANGSSGMPSGVQDTPGGGGAGGLVWNDPALMCIAIHFFQAAEQGGDELATSFMRQNDLV